MPAHDAVPLKIPLGSGAMLAGESRGEGAPVIFIHGWTLTRAMWRDQLSALPQGFRAIAYDRRGCGDSSGTPDWDCDSFDLLKLLDALKLERAILVGHSWGGRIGLRFAHDHPERLLGLAVAAAPLDGFVPEANPAERAPIRELAALRQASGMDAVRHQWLLHPLLRMPGASDEAILHLRDMVELYRGEDLDAPKTSGQWGRLAKELYKITVPSLVMIGELDTAWLHLVARALAYGIPAARLEILQGAGHMMNMTHAAMFNDRLFAFLEQFKS